VGPVAAGAEGITAGGGGTAAAGGGVTGGGTPWLGGVTGDGGVADSVTSHVELGVSLARKVENNAADEISIPCDILFISVFM
jgi:hypothetical protein